MDMAQFIDSALSDNGKVFVNCVFGRSRLKIILNILEGSFNKVLFSKVILNIVFFSKVILNKVIFNKVIFNITYFNCLYSTTRRSTSCVVAYLMLKHDWSALKALTHIREKRPIQVIMSS